ncbi:hypothetical protein KY339_00555 [Candidatus Woesearchaeota archaeon]|nr:hypothetical protein [Candidatus Woesearchaeota archaeon]
MAWETARSLPSLIIGLILLALGLIPLLNNWGVIAFVLPAFLSNVIAAIALWIIAGGGLYLVIDTFLEWGNPMAWLSFIVGIVVLAVGLIPLLNSFGVIGFNIPFLSVTVYNIIFVIEGFALFLASFFME